MLTRAARGGAGAATAAVARATEPATEGDAAKPAVARATERATEDAAAKPAAKRASSKSASSKAPAAKRALVEPATTGRAKLDAECAALARAWGWVLHGVAEWWNYNCDSGCFADTCRRAVHTEGPFLVIYQPTKAMIEYDDFVAAINIKRVDKKHISAALWAAAQPHIDAVNRLVLQSYNDVLAATGGKWDKPIDGSLDALLQTRQALHLAEDGNLKFKFEIRGATDGCCGNRWEPGRLMAWLGMSTHIFAPDGSVLPNVNIEDEMYRYNKPSTPARV